MCAMHMLFKEGTVCLWVAYPYLISDRICVCTLQTHMSCILLADFALAMEQVSSLCLIPIPPLLIGEGVMYRNSTPGSTIYTKKTVRSDHQRNHHHIQQLSSSSPLHAVS